ncbi:MAG: F-type H+-transporting ATPase subunit b [Myxococcota bacterium]|jgi:F-type H+-transporting ATPase subunit b
MNIVPIPLVVLLQAIPFLLTVFALYAIILKPMLAFLDARIQATEGARKEAETLQAQAEAQTNEYEKRLSSARAEVTALRAQRRKEAMKSYSATMDTVRKEVQGQINEALAQLESNRSTTRAELRTTAATLANQITGRILDGVA